MTLTTAAISARLRSTPQKYKLFLTLIQINRFFYRKTSLPHHTSAIIPQPSAFVHPHLSTINCYLLSINLPISQPSAFSHQPSFFPLTSYFIKHISLQPSAFVLPSSIFHLTSYFIHQPSYISHQTSAISHQPSIIFLLPSAIYRKTQ